MIKNKLELKRVKIMFLVVISIMQFYLFFYFNNNLEEDKSIEVPLKVEKLHLEQVLDEINLIEDIKIIEIEDKSTKWKLNTVIEGDYEKISLSISKLDKFIINDYTIYGDKDKLLVNLELYR